MDMGPIIDDMKLAWEAGQLPVDPWIMSLTSMYIDVPTPMSVFVENCVKPSPEGDEEKIDC